MDMQLFWTAFAAIGGTLGALATTTAVIVALWQTKYAHKKKISLSFYEGVSAVIGEKTHTFVGMSIANIGNRNIVIKNWGWFLNDGEMMLVSPLTDFPLNQMQPQLPYKLELEECTNLYMEKEKFLNNLQESITKKLLKPNQKIKFWVLDSVGKNHYVYSNKTVEELLSK